MTSRSLLLAALLLAPLAARGQAAGSVTLTAPAEPGSYEIRYASDSRIGTFARRPIEVR